MRLPRTQCRGVAHFVYAKWPRSGPEVWRSAGVIATLWQPRLVSCAGLVGQVEMNYSTLCDAKDGVSRGG